MTSFKLTLCFTAVAVALAACGGGGGGTSGGSTATTPPTPVTPTPPVVTPADLQTSVPAATYAAASQQLDFFNSLNDVRAKVGLGLLAQNSQLDTAAQSHAQYYDTNDKLQGGTVDMATFDPATGSPMAHIEKVGLPLFTGVSPPDRAKAAGYTGTIGEVLAYPGDHGTANGRTALLSLLGTVYHRAAVLDEGYRDVGIGVGKTANHTTVVDMGFNTKAQANAGDFVAVYPYDKQTGAQVFMYPETPNPLPDLSTSNTDFPTKTGYPISVTSHAGTKLEVVTFTITEAGSSSSLSARILGGANDANHLLKANTAFLIANAPLKVSTTYNVGFSGRVDNVVVNRTWSFTTGSGTSYVN